MPDQLDIDLESFTSEQLIAFARGLGRSTQLDGLVQLSLRIERELAQRAALSAAAALGAPVVAQAEPARDGGAQLVRPHQL